MNVVTIASISLLFLWMSASTQSALCPDQKTQCGDDMTCCKWSSGNYGCCPLASAQCCADGLHCCPNGTKCNDKEGTCDELTAQTPQRLPLTVGQQSSGVCPDKNQTCLQYETCCKEKSGSYGCCPYQSGVCCSDLLHCCPHGTRCDLIHKECVRAEVNIMGTTDTTDTDNSLTTRMRLIGFEATNVTRVVCPGSRYTCPDNNTCCHISASQWGCCPLLNAVCCRDGIHCCPSGTTCTTTGCQ